MEPKVALLIVENRETILFQYMKYVIFLLTQGKVKIVHYSHLLQRKQIWYMRQQMIKRALAETDCTHVLFIDTDVVPQNDIVEKLLVHDKPVVSGFYCDQQGTPAIRKDGRPYIGKELEEVDVCSMGLSLWKREVLEKVEYTMPDPPHKLDGDTEFCGAVKAAGFPIFADFSLRAAHLLLKVC